MAFNVDTKQDSSPIKLYTGLADFRPMLINPTKNELNRIGVNFEDEPVYITTDDNGIKRLRIDIWGEVTGTDIKENEVKFINKLTFFLDNTEKESSTGKYEYINEFGDTCWVEEGTNPNDVYSWFPKSQYLRKAKNGEGLFISFLKGYLSIGRNEIAKIDDINTFLSGNLREVKNFFSPNNDRKIQVLLTIREYDGNYYQTIFSRYFSTPGNTRTKYWKKLLDSQTTKPFYQNSFILKEFDPRVTESSISSESSDSDSIWGE